jgi:hypothetical protein
MQNLDMVRDFHSEVIIVAICLNKIVPITYVFMNNFINALRKELVYFLTYVLLPL